MEAEQGRVRRMIKMIEARLASPSPPWVGASIACRVPDL
jgi:hypothetical protein